MILPFGFEPKMAFAPSYELGPGDRSWMRRNNKKQKQRNTYDT